MKLFLSYHIKRSVCIEQKLDGFINFVPVSWQFRLFYLPIQFSIFNPLTIHRKPLPICNRYHFDYMAANMAWIFCLITLSLWFSLIMANLNANQKAQQAKLEKYSDSKKKWTEISHKWEVKLQTYFKETELNGNTERRSFPLFFTHAVPSKV